MACCASVFATCRVISACMSIFPVAVEGRSVAKSEPVYGFASSGSIRRVVDAVRWCESQRTRTTTAGQPDGGSGGGVVALIETTGEYESGGGTGVYPAKAVTWDDGAGEGKQWVDLGPVRYRDANGDENLAVGTRVLARFMGSTSDGLYGLFVGAAGGDDWPIYARLTDTSVAGYSWVERVFDGSHEIDGEKSGSFNAEPVWYWDIPYALYPVGEDYAGTPVLLWPTGYGYLFMPMISADATTPGYVSTQDQVFGGQKTMSGVVSTGNTQVGASLYVGDPSKQRLAIWHDYLDAGTFTDVMHVGLQYSSLTRTPFYDIVHSGDTASHMRHNWYGYGPNGDCFSWHVGNDGSRAGLGFMRLRVPKYVGDPPDTFFGVSCTGTTSGDNPNLEVRSNGKVFVNGTEIGLPPPPPPPPPDQGTW